MRRLAPARGRASGFSSLYGAFGVVLVSLVVAGLIAKTAPQAQGTAREEKAAAVEFLEALLGSSVGTSDGTLRAYLSYACLEEPCGPEAHARAAVEANFTKSAQALAKGLGRAFGLVVYTPFGEWLRVGAQAPSAGVGPARADVFHPGSSSFLTVVAWLSPP